MLSILLTTAYPGFTDDPTSSSKSSKRHKTSLFLTTPTTPIIQTIQNTLAPALVDATVAENVRATDTTLPTNAQATSYTATPATNGSGAKLNSSEILSPGIVRQP